MFLIEKKKIKFMQTNVCFVHLYNCIRVYTMYKKLYFQLNSNFELSLYLNSLINSSTVNNR